MKNLIILFLIVFSINAFGQSKPEDLIEQFFSEYESKGAIAALDNLYATNKWLSRSQDAIENVKNQLKDINNLVGEYYGYEFIVKKCAGQSFCLYSYLVKYDRQPVRFTFEFYKPNDKWIAFGFSFDEEIDDELEEAAKMYFLREY